MENAPSDGEILTPTVAILLEIMVSTGIAEARCVEAAKAVIEYEVSPGLYALVSRYLLGVAEDTGQDAGLRLEALRTLRKVEARRVVPGTLPSPQEERLAVRMGAAQERLARHRAGLPMPAPDIVPSVGIIKGDGIAARLDRAVHRSRSTR